MDLPSIQTTPVDLPQNTAFTQLADNFDTFLTLLTTQLQNQDPLEPLDTEQFTQQLVQFASVEQSIQSNSHLQTLIDLQSSTDRDAALGFLGREVSVSGETPINRDGAAWQVNLTASPASVDYNVVNAAGETIRTINGPAVAGNHQILWDGRADDGSQAPEGQYRLSVSAITTSGAEIETSVTSQAQVTGIDLRGPTPSLETNAGIIPLANVQRVTANIGE